jgi:uncharacterized membrane-anchored protein YhcB (DUF1043 family)
MSRFRDDEMVSGKLVNQQDNLIKDLERQLDEAREEIESYKYDLETLVSVVTDCLNKMSSEECYDTLQQVVNHYEKLKEKGE